MFLILGKTTEIRGIFFFNPPVSAEDETEIADDRLHELRRDAVVLHELLHDEELLLEADPEKVKTVRLLFALPMYGS